MNKLILLLVLILSANFSFAQNLAWAKSIGGTGQDNSSSITTDANGNVYTTGYFEGTVDFNPGTGIFTLSAVGNKDIFISKLDASGNFIWGKSLGAVGDDGGRFIGTDAAGNLYVTGSFSGTVDFDPGINTYTLASVGDKDIFILKLDSAGNLIWAKSLGGVYADYGASIALDNLGNIYMTGGFGVAADFDPGAGVFNLNIFGGGMFILKLDPLGNFIWAKAVGCPTAQGAAVEAASIVLDAAQNIYTTGHFTGMADFDPGVGSYTLNTNYNMQTYICKLNAFGNFVWAKNFEGNFNFGIGMALDAFANVYVGGMFSGNANFDPSIASIYTVAPVGGIDAYIVKLDSAGNLGWAKTFGGINDDGVSSLVLDPSGNIYATGSFKGTADFDGGQPVYTVTSTGDYDVFVTQLDPSGNFMWAKTMGGTGSDLGNAIGLDAFGNILLTGVFNSTCDFDPGPSVLNLTSSGGNDVFILKLGKCTIAISSQPANQVVAMGNTAQFFTAASNSAALFQWQQNTGSGFADLSNGGQYSGATTASLIVSNLLLAQNNFSFRCVVTQSSCVTISNNALLTVYDATGIEENSNKNPFIIYPNPATDQITITMQNPAAVAFKIMDQTGREVFSGQLTGNETTVNIESLAAGLYFISLDKGNKKPMKIIKY